MTLTGNPSRKTPIVLAAFGTTTSAMKTYSYINDICLERFPDHPLLWAFSSRIVRHRSSVRMQQPQEVLAQLQAEGHEWAVVQSLHLMCGHEFYRLIEDVGQCAIRTSMGLPLLSEPEDYQAVVRTIVRDFSGADDEALVLVGHGTDHPGWCSYVALDHLIRQSGATGIYVGIVEHGYPTMASVVAEVRKGGYRKVRLVPFLLVAGMHFEEDLSGSDESWRLAFEDAGVSVSLENRGMGFNPGVIDIFCRHIEDALDVIPVNVGK